MLLRVGQANPALDVRIGQHQIGSRLESWNARLFCLVDLVEVGNERARLLDTKDQKVRTCLFSEDSVDPLEFMLIAA